MSSIVLAIQGIREGWWGKSHLNSNHNSEMVRGLRKRKRRKMTRNRYLRFVRKEVALTTLGLLLFPYLVSAYYACSGERYVEQMWLDRILAHVRTIKDPELQPLIAYTLKRYSTIGAFDVMIMPCIKTPTAQYVGANVPYCPGLTIDPQVMDWGPHDGAKVLLHEAAHDFFPYFHPIINNLTDQVDGL
jgi:hypothetical protein